MSQNVADFSNVFTPEQIGALVVQPVQQASVAMQVSTVVSTSSHDYRIPIVSSDPSAAWVAEGEEISESELGTDEIVCTPSKVAGLVVASRELVEDSNPSAQAEIGNGLARDIARKVDAAWFAASTTNGPAGLESLTMSTVEGNLTNLDSLYEAVTVSAGFGGVIGSFVTHPNTALALKQIKTDSTDSNETLPYPGDLPAIVTSPTATEGVLYGIDARFASVVMRDQTRIDVDRSVYFTSDRVAVRATMRVGFAFPYESALVKVNVGTGS